MPKKPTDLDSNYEPVSPVDIVNGPKRARGVGFPSIEDQKQVHSSTRSVRTNSTSSSTLSLKAPRTTRFAEATTVHSPVSGPNETRSPFADPPKMAEAEPKPSDVGFGYISNDPVQQQATLRSDMYAQTGAPLKSALKTPGTPGRHLNPLSPTFREEQMLEKEEGKTEIQQAKDLKIKTRVRMAKFVLRGVNFSCSLIVLSMLSTTFSIFNATKSLPPRNNLPVWATGNKPWPQIVVLIISCISLAFAVIIMYLYWRGGHNRAQKTAVYYTLFSVGFFMFSTVMWLVGAGVLHGSKATGNGQDIWGWSCKDNKRRQLFESDVHYALVCRLQNWSLLCCIIEVVVEVITISIYAVIFYRFYSKNRLRKSMDARDRARSDLYLAQLRTQSAPNTPGYAASQTPRSARFPTMDSKSAYANEYAVAEDGNSPVQYAAISPVPQAPSPFKLQAPPIKIHHATPKERQDGFEDAPSMSSRSPPPPEPQERFNEHVEAAPGEQTYDAVPIPGAYASPLTSPAFQPQHASMAEQMRQSPVPEYRPGQAY